MKKIIKSLAIIILFLAVSCKKEKLANAPANSTEVGINKNETDEIISSDRIIGTLDWSERNLDVLFFRTGEPIPLVTTARAWRRAGELGQPACCFYRNDAMSGATYGVLYNWYAVRDARGLAPAGWRVATYDDWYDLINHTGGIAAAGLNLKSTSGWRAPGNGLDMYGFTGLPGGLRTPDGSFQSERSTGVWWASTLVTGTRGYLFSLYYGDNAVHPATDYKGFGFSVRCVRD